MDQLLAIIKLCGSPSKEYWRKADLPRAETFRPRQTYRRCIVDKFRELPAPALSLIETLLLIDPGGRLSAAQALNSEVPGKRRVWLILLCAFTKRKLERGTLQCYADGT